MSRYYTLDKNTYPRFLHDDREGGCLSLYIIHLVVFDLVFDYLFVYAEMDLFAFLDSTIGRVVPLLPVAPARAEGDLEASVDRLFDEGGNTNQGDSDASGGRNDVIEPVTDVEDIAAENVTAQRPKRQRKKRPAVTVGVATGGKSPSIIKELLASSILNAEAGVTAVATLPFITSSISATPECEGGYPTDSVSEPNLRTIGPTERFVISSDSSHHSSINASGAEVDSIIRYVVLPPMMTEAVVTSHATSAPSIPVPETETKNTSLVHPSIFPNSGFAETVRPDVTCPFYSAEQDLSMGSRELNTDTLHQVFVPQCNVLNDSLLDDSDFNVGTARQACLYAEVRMQTEYCLGERRRLESECKKQADLLKARDGEIENLKAQLLLKEAEATKKNVALEKEKDALDGKVAEFQSSIVDKERELKDLNVIVSSLKSHNDDLVDQVHALETTCSNLRDQVAKLDADLVEMALYLEEKFYPHLLTTISGRRWLLTRGLKLVVVKGLNSPEYLAALGSAISRAIKKGIQSDLSAGIDHGKAGRSLADVVAYNPAA
ncbi:hypothetical protein Tco_0711456 [Tanacetum coccineum]